MKKQCAQVIFAGLLILSQSTYALEYYRYKDEKGIVAIDATIPPEYVKYGYEVLNSMGLVVRTVAPELSEEEKAIQEKKKREEARFEEFKNRLNKLYRSPTDVDRAVTAYEERVTVSIAAQKRRINRHQQLYDDAQAKAAKAQRNNKTVPQVLLDQMEEAQEYIYSLELSIEDKKDDILEKRIRYKQERDVMFIVYKERYYEEYVDSVSKEALEQLYYVPPEYVPREPRNKK